MKKRVLCLLVSLLLAAGKTYAWFAQAYAVLDADTGILLDGGNENARLPMASTTKIMTGLLAAEEEELDRIVTVSDTAAGVEGSSMYLQAGEQLPLRDVLYGLLLCSGNDAAACIAENIGGQEAFVRRMNERAAALGLVDTHFDNPSGLDGETHYTTARELALLTSSALQNETFAEIVATKSYTSGTRTMVNHNKLLRLYDGAVGVKTGYTQSAGRCLVSAAERDGRTVIAVTLNDGNDWNDHMQMLDAAFGSLRTETAARAGETAAVIPVEAGTERTVTAVYQDDLTAGLFEGERAEIQLSQAEFLYAPVERGTICGYARLVCGGTVLAETALVCQEAAELDGTQEDRSRRERLRLWWDSVCGRIVT